MKEYHGILADAMSSYKTPGPWDGWDKGYSKIIAPNGTVTYRLHGQLHRKDGPAFVSTRGKNSWWLYGKRYNNQNLYQLGSGMSDEETMAMVLKYGGVR